MTISTTASSRDPAERAAAVLDQIAARLSSDVLESLIDEPIDRAFLIEDSNPQSMTAQSLIQQVSRRLAAVSYLHNGFGSSDHSVLLDDRAARLIDDAFGGRTQSGFEQALLEANDLEFGGLSVVLVRVAEYMKSDFRRLYRDWVFSLYLDQWDHDCVREIAHILLKRCPYPPNPVTQTSHLSAWVHLIPKLWEQASLNSSFWGVGIDPKLHTA